MTKDKLTEWQVETIPELRAYARKLFGSQTQVRYQKDGHWSFPVLTVSTTSFGDFRIEELPRRVAIAAAVTALHWMKRRSWR
jgi:hypothetical protein